MKKIIHIIIFFTCFKLNSATIQPNYFAYEEPTVYQKTIGYLGSVVGSILLFKEIKNLVINKNNKLLIPKVILGSLLLILSYQNLQAQKVFCKTPTTLNDLHAHIKNQCVIIRNFYSSKNNNEAIAI